MSVRNYTPSLPPSPAEVEGLEADGEGVMLVAFSEEDLALLYPNHQLDANHTLIDTFIRVCGVLCV